MDHFSATQRKKNSPSLYILQSHATRYAQPHHQVRFPHFLLEPLHQSLNRSIGHPLKTPKGFLPSNRTRYLTIFIHIPIQSFTSPKTNLSNPIIMYGRLQCLVSRWICKSFICKPLLAFRQPDNPCAYEKHSLVGNPSDMG